MGKNVQGDFQICISIPLRKTSLFALFEHLKKKLYGPFLWMGFNCLKARATSGRQCTFYHEVPRNSWYSFYRSRKDERLSQPWSHPLGLLSMHDDLLLPPSMNGLIIFWVLFGRILMKI